MKQSYYDAANALLRAPKNQVFFCDGCRGLGFCPCPYHPTDDTCPYCLGTGFRIHPNRRQTDGHALMSILSRAAWDPSYRCWRMPAGKSDYLTYTVWNNEPPTA